MSDLQPPPQASSAPACGAAALPARRRSPWMIWLSLLLAALLLYLAVRGLAWADFWAVLQSGNYAVFVLVALVASANYIIRALRWSLLVRTAQQVPVTTVFWANMAGYMGNAYLPARAGELVRSSFLGEKSGLGTSFVLGTALTERLMDLVALVLVGTTALLTRVANSPLLTNILRLLALAGLAGLIFIVVAPFHAERIRRIVAWMPLPGRIAVGLSTQVQRFLTGMQSLYNGRRLAAFLALTFVIWLVDAMSVMVGVRFVSQTLDIAQALVLLAALGLSSAIPSTPGYVGVSQFVAVVVLVPFGFSQPAALAYIIATQMVSYVVVSFWGLLGLWQINRGA